MVMPIYQKAGIQLASIPQMTTVGIQEAGRTSEVLAQQLDRLSRFAFQQAEVEAKITGREYGALNAPSAQQLQDAVARGEDPAKQVPGDKTTVFGQTAREAALSSLTTSMEIEARKSIVNLQAAFEAKEITLEEMASNMETLVAAQTDVVRRVSPEAATKFSASIGVVSNSAFLAAAKEQAKQNKSNIEIEMRFGIDAAILNIETIVKGGATKDSYGDMSSVDDKLDTVRSNIKDMAQILGDSALYQSKIKEFNDAATEAKINVVAEYIQDDPLNLIPDLDQDGKYLEDEDVKNIFASLSTKERAAVKERVDNYVDELQAEEDSREARAARRRTENAQKLAPMIHNAIKSDNEEQVKTLMDEMEKLDYTLWKSFTSVVNGGGGVFNDPAVVQSLDFKTTTGNLALTELNQAFADRKITQSKYDEIFTRFQQQSDTRFARGVEYARNVLNYPEYDSLDMASEQRLAIIQMNELENEYSSLRESATIEGTLPEDPYKFFVRRVKEIKNAGFDPAAITKAKLAINTFLSERGITISSYDELTIPNTLPPAQYGELDQAKKLLMENDIEFEVIR